MHDIGKCNPAFQDYLIRLDAGEKLSHGPPHAIWGAALAYCLFHKDSELYRITVLPVLGHHSGLDADSRATSRLTEFLSENQDEVRALLRPLSPLLKSGSFKRPNGADEMFVRMIFSALTDADYLATEAHFNGIHAAVRDGGPPLGDLWARFETDQDRVFDEAVQRGGELNAIRREVYDSCLAAAQYEPGIFRLTVPTGGGKTRSSLAFALQHALKYGLRRVLVVLPYTSIIEQTARAFRAALGYESVLEHHSQLNESNTESQKPGTLRLKLAMENWDAPVIVTTTVQFFESLFSNRPGRCRKLHRIARSVVVLDEVQALPVELLRPTMHALRLLADQYACTIVLCTATQPTFDDTPYLRELAGMEVREIVPDYARHFQVLQRVKYEIRREPVTFHQVADEIRNVPQVMVVLNTRRDALALMDCLGPRPDTFHLSTLLCGKHRRAVLRLIRFRLRRGQLVTVISTQVVEAGVDLDFPEVWRAVGPLDRIVQAAGRCNREGKLRELGKVVVFKAAEGRQPKGPYRIGCELSEAILATRSGEDLHNPALYREYFQKLFSLADLDKRHIQEFCEAYDFPEVATRYRMIDDTVPAIVHHRGWKTALDRWRAAPSRGTWQRLQPYLVNFFHYEAKQYIENGDLAPVSEGVYEWTGKYDRIRGVVAAALDPADLIV